MSGPNQWRPGDHLGAWIAIVVLFFAYAGDAPPGVNEAHYLVKAKNFWQPEWCAGDLFASSGKAHWTFYVVFGWPTQFVSLAMTAWIGRFVGWTMLAIGWTRVSQSLGVRAGWSILAVVIWLAGIERGNLAGEWVVGGIEAKVPAYGLALLGLANVVRRRWNHAWVWLGAASAFHVLTGGWSVVAASIAYGACEKPWRRDPTRPAFFTRYLFLGGAISLFGLVPALAMSWGATDGESVAAARTYAYFRISHHLTPAAFHRAWYIRHAVLLLATLVAAWWVRRTAMGDRGPWDRLLAFGGGAVLIALTGLLVGCLPAVMPDLAAKLLRFYWFRLSDAVVPLVLAWSIAGAGQGTWNRWAAGSTAPLHRAIGVVMLPVILAGILSFASLAASAWDRTSTGVPVSVSNRLLGMEADADYARQRQTMQDWIAVCRFVRASTPTEAVLLTPRHQQTFKWYAHRAEVVNWKDVPQDAGSLLEWSRRFVEVFPFRLSTMRTTIRYDDLRELRRRYGVDWMVVDRRVTGPQLPLVQVYPADDLGDDQSGDAVGGRSRRNRTYAVYRLP